MNGMQWSKVGRQARLTLAALALAAVALLLVQGVALAAPLPDDPPPDEEYPEYIMDVPEGPIRDVAMQLYDSRIWLSVISLIIAGAAYAAQGFWEEAGVYTKRALKGVAMAGVIFALIPVIVSLLF